MTNLLHIIIQPHIHVLINEMQKSISSCSNSVNLPKESHNNKRHVLYILNALIETFWITLPTLWLLCFLNCLVLQCLCVFALRFLFCPFALPIEQNYDFVCLLLYILCTLVSCRYLLKNINYIKYYYVFYVILHYLCLSWGRVFTRNCRLCFVLSY